MGDNPPFARRPASRRMPALAPYVPLVVATRGDADESVHYGAVAVADRDGRVLFAAGDAQAVVFTRSALKPLQALPFVRAGGVERYGLSGEQVALMCASHSGEPRHVAGVADLLARAGNTPDDLQCGTHVPGWYEARGEVPPPPPYSPLAHNCSGKHAGMLACCALHGWRRDDYLEPGHPLQQSIRAAVAGYAGVPEASLVMGIDGCSAPNYALPLAALARAFARLSAGDAAGEWGDAPRRLRDAMTAHPEMVSGEGRSDAALMRAGGSDWVAKIGAEGVQAIGVASRGLGIAIKVADGGRRAIGPAVVAVLDRLGLLDEARRAALAKLGAPTLRNYRGLATGALRSVVELRPC
jgi:L-asparaginase II